MDTKVKEALDLLGSLAAKCTDGDRHICVLDRGWIFAGKLHRDDKGINTLTDCCNIIRWTGGGGIGRVATDPKLAKVEVAPSAPIRFRDSAMIFAIPIPENWNA